MEPHGTHTFEAALAALTGPVRERSRRRGVPWRAGAAPRTSAAADVGRIAAKLRDIARSLSEREAELPPSGGREWFLDNQPLVQRAARVAGEGLSGRLLRALPTLLEGRWAGLPRAEALARAALELADGAFDAGLLRSLVDGVVAARPLRQVELWALPTFLRWTCLRALTPAAEALRQAGDRPQEDAVAAAAVRSLLALERWDWLSFVESVSPVHASLAADPAGVYPRMDFASRDRYRHAVERLARRSGMAEGEVARTACELAAAAEHDPIVGLRALRSHVGYYLVDRGVAELERALGLPGTARRGSVRATAWAYASAMALLTAALTVPAVLALAESSAPAALCTLVGVLALAPAVRAAACLLHWGLARWVPPRVLPRLDPEQGIPADAMTLVAIPAIVAGMADVEALTHKLELHHASNADPNLSFALLTDGPDAPRPTMPGETQLLAALGRRVGELNHQYGTDDEPRFFWLHRERRWNPGEDCWMGWERKRGKIEELIELIARGERGTFVRQPFPDSVRRRIRYVLTLDADTTLPPGQAARLVTALVHPLNLARLDPRGERVVRGFTFAQPRLDVHPGSAQATRYARLFLQTGGLDLYAHPISDAVMDLFGQGVYQGKALIDVHAFASVVADRVPDNAVLSHDLLEGSLGGTAFVSDAFLLEDAPRNYLAQARRLERWARGDWQLLPWLLGSGARASRGQPPGPSARRPRPPGSEAQAARSTRLQRLALWQMTMTLVGNLAAPAALALLVAAWALAPAATAALTAVAAGYVVAPHLPAFLDLLAGLRVGVASGRLLRSAGLLGLDALVDLAVLPHMAVLQTRAGVRTLYRLLVSRRHLLQWTASTLAERALAACNLRRRVWLELIPTPLAGVLGVILLAAQPAVTAAALPLSVLWALAPALVLWTARPPWPRRRPLTAPDVRTLRRLARRTWLFFERFVGPEDHWLPPDHFQEQPRGIAAHRTSPTNIGLYLAASLSAFDLGYLGAVELIARCGATLATLQGLERYRGHFLNWYDTRTLGPLAPRYVSTVDSGNLAASLVALRQGLLQLPDEAVWRPQRWHGILDTLEGLEGALGTGRFEAAGRAVSEVARALRAGIRADLPHPDAWPARLRGLSDRGLPQLDARLLELARTVPLERSAPRLMALSLWAQRLRAEIGALRREVDDLLPWHAELDGAPPALRSAGPSSATGRAWRGLVEDLPVAVALGRLGSVCDAAMLRVQALRRAAASELTGIALHAAEAWLSSFEHRLAAAAEQAEQACQRSRQLAADCNAMLMEADYTFLYDRWRHVFRLGYRVDDDAADDNAYDLLASEARTASLLAIALRQVPMAHWLHLARPFGRLAGSRGLLSWSGTAFEYLMPSLFMTGPPDTLLASSCTGAVREQIAHGREHGLPWGVSESAFALLGADGEYQYQAFGVPSLALRRSPGDERVVAPYASVLALPFAPQAVVANLRALRRAGARGDYGLIEALDFTPSRLALGRRVSQVRTYMAHHQGMILIALANAVAAPGLPARFLADPRVAGVEPLLHEQLPTAAPIERAWPAEPRRAPAPTAVPVGRWKVAPTAAPPQVWVLSNGRYRLALDHRGCGQSLWRDVALSRWRADATLVSFGPWLHLRDLDNGELWSAAAAPCRLHDPAVAVEATPHGLAFRRSDHGLRVHLEATVDPERDAELWRLELHNLEPRTRRLALTRSLEPALAAPPEDRRHPAFVKLFVAADQPTPGVVVVTRRRRSPADRAVAWQHQLTAEPGLDVRVSVSTDRREFLGRWGDPAAPAALRSGGPLPGLEPLPLDPVMALQGVVTVPPFGVARLAFVAAAGASPADAARAAAPFGTWVGVRRAFDQAARRGAQEVARLGLDAASLRLVQRLQSALIYPHGGTRAATPPGLGVRDLWRFGISGDRPILTIRLRSADVDPLVRFALRAHAFWRDRGLEVDLVLLNEVDRGYRQPLALRLRRLMHLHGADAWLERPGGVFPVVASSLPDPDRALLTAAARVVLDSATGTVADQLAELERVPPPLPPLPVERTSTLQAPRPVATGPERLLFDNGFGGFSEDGRSYLVRVSGDAPTPAPWANVLANEAFGTLVTERGSSTTWAHNSGENRLTPWSNDPLLDPSGEALYLRDEETGAVWTPTPGPAPGPGGYEVRHAAHHTTFSHEGHGLRQRLQIVVAHDAPVKLAVLQVTDLTGRPRRVTATYTVEWVLGTDRDATQAAVVPEYAVEVGAMLARNPLRLDHADHVAFLASDRPVHGLTTDRSEFFGDGGRVRPSGLVHVGLSGHVRPGPDPMAALQVHLDVPAGGSQRVVFVLGEGADRDEAVALVRRFTAAGEAERATAAAEEHWDGLLERVQVSTPDAALDLLVNRWLLHQAVACRLWGRSAVYQSSGAYGFRDQLQDSLALLHCAPRRVREHLLLAARHQFAEGDVLHWWHAPGARGVRTRISDDLVWLPYVTARYVEATGDGSVLDESVPFLAGRPLAEGEDERYAEHVVSEQVASLTEHCLRALDHADRHGVHGLPRIGTGDWNDGFNRVGHHGRGESVWLAWFLLATMRSFGDVLRHHGGPERADELDRRAATLAEAVEARAWDGAWYLRAFYDDGRPMGGHGAAECSIDGIAQAWAALSGRARPERARTAMRSVLERLVRDEDSVVLLFTPPFLGEGADPGYIRAYPPGVRENGGQYTHGAIWAAWALATLGEADEAHRLFRLLTPIRHAQNRDAAERYRVEPYVVAADVGGEPPYAGRGGWSWYTGSAAWLYRLALEGLLGVQREGDVLRMRPCIPADWPGFEVRYRFGSSRYRIEVGRSPAGGAASVELDGVALPDGRIPLRDDGVEHHVRVTLGATPAHQPSASAAV